MSAKQRDELVDRANKMSDALKIETHRGSACVGDAMLDELLKELFHKRLSHHKNDVKDVLSEGQLLGNHGGRLRFAYLLGWIGPELHADCHNIHRIRNRMAHRLDVDTFDHEQVRDLVDGLQSLKQNRIMVRGEVRRVNLIRREDRFQFAVWIAILRFWRLIKDSSACPVGIDPPILSEGVPRR